MGDKSIMKVNMATAPKGKLGQKYLAAGVGMSMRLWEDEQPGEPKPESRRPYETIGYVIGGRAELHLEGQMVLLEPFTAVEATHPPAEVHGRDEG